MKIKEKFEEISEYLINLKILHCAYSNDRKEKTIFYVPSSAKRINITYDNDKIISFNLEEVKLLSLSYNGLLLQHLNKMYSFKLLELKNIKVE